MFLIKKRIKLKIYLNFIKKSLQKKRFGSYFKDSTHLKILKNSGLHLFSNRHKLKESNTFSLYFSAFPFLSPFQL